jgi:hypothetical protein
MKMSPEQKKALSNMLPGVIAQTGFLGDDHRKLVDIIAHDEELMQKSGLDFETLIERMKYLLAGGMKGMGEPIEIDGKWLVKVDEARGFLPCPYEDGIFRKRNVQVKHKVSGGQINYTELSIHLIEVHHFFQGKGAFYRLEPDTLKHVLEL